MTTYSEPIGRFGQQMEVVCHDNAGRPVVVPVSYAALLSKVAAERKADDVTEATPADVETVLPFVPASDLIRRVILLDTLDVDQFCEPVFADPDCCVGVGEKDIYLFKHKTGQSLIVDLFAGWAWIAFDYFEMEQKAYRHAFALECPERFAGDASADWISKVVELLTNGLPSQHEGSDLRFLVLAGLLTKVAANSSPKAVNVCQARAKEVMDKLQALPLLKRHMAAAGKDALTLAVWLLDNPEKLVNPAALDLSGEMFNDTHVRKIAGMSGLKELDLSGTLISTGALESVSSLRQLTRLNLQGTAVENSGMRQLEDLPLVELNLARTRVSDGGLTVVGRIKTLQRLDLRGTVVTEGGVIATRKALPACEISR